MDFVNVFDEATRDHEAEARDLRLTAASIEAQEVWPFLATAESLSDFANRVALREDRLSAIAAKHGVEWDDVVGPLERGFEALRATAGLVCKRCDHTNAPHSQGQVCTCGCTSFAPKTAAVGPMTGPSDTGPSYDPESIHDLPLNGTKSNPQYYYDEGYEHGKGNQAYKGYGGRDMAILYGHGYRHGQQDAGKNVSQKAYPENSKSSAKTAAGNPDCQTGYGTQDPSKCACPSCLNHPDSQMSDADKNYHRQVNDLTSRNDPGSPEFNDFDPNTHHQDMYGDGFKTHRFNGHTVHEFASTAQGYNHSQTSDNIKDGDVLSVPSEGVHGFLYKAWPVASTEEHGEFHKANMDGLLGENPEYQGAHDVASSLAHIQPKNAALDHIAVLHKALMEGVDPLEWIQEQNPPGGPQYAEVPSGHDEVQRFPADGTTGGAPDAMDQALKQGSLTQEGGGPF